ncbi:MAG: hypothetical protein HFG08_10655 [Oscillibacter sp.]|jgi:flagellar hook-length control protein FliK|nr:hypothetical protein [Oscillibacter sp.]
MTDYWFTRTVDQLTSDPLLKAPSGKTNGKPADDFQKILERSSGDAKPEAKPGSESEGKAVSKPAGSKTEAKPQEGEAAPKTQEAVPGTEDLKTLENQMALAAMAMMQSPAVVMPEEQAPQEAENGILALAAVDPEAAVEMPVQAETVPAGEETFQMLPEEGASNAEGMIQQKEAGELPVEAEQAPQTVETESEAPEMAVSVTKGGEEAVSQDTGKDETPVDTPVETPVFENVRDIPVKVGEAPVEEPEPEPEIPVEDQIGPKLAQALNAGDTRVELQLNPENLGHVTVEMTLAENGSLHVTLHAESGKTMNLLEKGLDNLHLMLARNAQQDVQVEVQKQEESQQQNFYDGRGGHAQHQDQRRERREEQRDSENFFQQLRLGLIPEDGQ